MRERDKTGRHPERTEPSMTENYQYSHHGGLGLKKKSLYQSIRGLINLLVPKAG